MALDEVIFDAILEKCKQIESEGYKENGIDLAEELASIAGKAAEDAIQKDPNVLQIVTLAIAQTVCAKNGYAPLPKETLAAMQDMITLLETAIEGVASFKPVIGTQLSGKKVTKQDLKRNYEALEELEKFLRKKKPQYAAVKESIQNILKVMEK